MIIPFSAVLPDRTGSVLSSGNLRLRLMTIIGSGAYGVIYLAHDDIPKSGGSASYYAVKMLLRDPVYLQQQEISHLRALGQHPHITTLREVIEEEYYVYLVMDYYPGGDLFDAIVNRRVFWQNDERIRAAFLQVLDAVQFCHEQGVYHRDIKLENIMCSVKEDTFYLGDFGHASDKDVAGTLGSGSLYCMSPESLVEYEHGRPYAAAHADVWALGIALVNMISGACPWVCASTESDKAFASYLHEGPSWFERKLGMSAGASELVAGILEVDVSKRMSIDQIRDAVKGMRTFYSALYNGASVTEVSSMVSPQPAVDRPRSLKRKAAIRDLRLASSPQPSNLSSEKDSATPTLLTDRELDWDLSSEREGSVTSEDDACEPVISFDERNKDVTPRIKQIDLITCALARNDLRVHVMKLPRASFPSMPYIVGGPVTCAVQCIAMMSLLYMLVLV